MMKFQCLLHQILTLYEEERDLIPKLPGQTTDDIKAPTRQVFEYVYKNFTDSNARKYLENIQPWLYFRRQHNRPDYFTSNLRLYR